MPQSPRWLTTLMRVREHHRDAARQLLAKSLSVAKTANDAAQTTTEKLSQLATVQQQESDSRHIDVDRLRQLRATRDDLRTELAERLRHQAEAAESVKQAQHIAGLRESELEVLTRLSDRYQATHRITQQRREEQILSESVVTLCIGEGSA
jgi:hypothetical protein